MCAAHVYCLFLLLLLNRNSIKVNRGEHDGVLNAVFAPKRYRDQMNGVKVIVV